MEGRTSSGRIAGGDFPGGNEGSAVEEGSPVGAVACATGATGSAVDEAGEAVVGAEVVSCGAGAVPGDVTGTGVGAGSGGTGAERKRNGGAPAATR